MYELKNYSVAIDIYKNLVKADPKSATGWYDLACCYALQNNLDLALQHLRQAIELEPEKLKHTARTDADFTSLYENEVFKNLVA